MCFDVLDEQHVYMMCSRSDGRVWRVFYHFAGATPCSSELLPMLRRLLLVMETVPVSTEHTSLLQKTL